jgi:hypothetical protein
MSDDNPPVLGKSDSDTLAFALLRYGLSGQKYDRLLAALARAGLRSPLLTKSAPPPDPERK